VLGRFREPVTVKTRHYPRLVSLAKTRASHSLRLSPNTPHEKLVYSPGLSLGLVANHVPHLPHRRQRRSSQGSWDWF
jgi:hypothetical protein